MSELAATAARAPIDKLSKMYQTAVFGSHGYTIVRVSFVLAGQPRRQSQAILHAHIYRNIEVAFVVVLCSKAKGFPVFFFFFWCVILVMGALLLLLWLLLS